MENSKNFSLSCCLKTTSKMAFVYGLSTEKNMEILKSLIALMMVKCKMSFTSHFTETMKTRYNIKWQWKMFATKVSLATINNYLVELRHSEISILITLNSQWLWIFGQNAMIITQQQLIGKLIDDYNQLTANGWIKLFD